jgi:hypothetical protein
MGKSYQERGVFIYDEEAKNIYTNKAYQEMTRCTREELLKYCPSMKHIP